MIEKAYRHDRRPGVSGMNEQVKEGEHENHDIADQVQPGRRLIPNPAVAEEIGQAGNRGKYAPDQSDQNQPGGKVRPHHLGGYRISVVGHQRADEAGDRNRHQHRVDRMVCNSSRRAQTRKLLLGRMIGWSVKARLIGSLRSSFTSPSALMSAPKQHMTEGQDRGVRVAGKRVIA